MITIIHGDDVIASRNFLFEQKDKNSLTFDAESLDISELKQEVAGSGLFGPSIKIFIENLFTRKGSKNLSGIISVLNDKTEADVYIWSDKILSAKVLLDFPKHTIQLFKIPQNIWSFLDGIRPGRPGNVLSFRQALSNTEPEIVFAMVIRQFRLMLGLIESSGSSIDEVKRLAPWQRSKLLRQALMFEIDKLKQIYKKLYKIEKAVKTGKSPLTLPQNIDILLLEI